MSATYLYACSREFTGADKRSVYDDVQGYPMGHFVVLCGFTPGGRQRIMVADPYRENPHGESVYTVSARRLIHSILLGVVTYDGNLLIIEPRS